LENNACQQESGTGNVILGTGVGLKAAWGNPTFIASKRGLLTAPFVNFIWQQFILLNLLFVSQRNQD
jgi:hypothetical protein